MPRFVILTHDHPSPHWDLLLDAGAVLRAWRLAAPPADGAAVAAEASSDHRPMYLDYEGPVSGGRGGVSRWDGGTFAWEVGTVDRVRVRLAGGRLHGVLRLSRGQDGAWTCEFAADAG
jgi:hypothetical protein